MAFAADIAAQALVVSLDAELAPISEIKKKFSSKKKKKRFAILTAFTPKPAKDALAIVCRSFKQSDQTQLVVPKAPEATITASHASAPLV